MAIIPGQWYTDGPTQFHRWLVKSDDNGTEYMVAKCWGDGDGDDESTARLIAAAPELLAALHDIITCAHISMPYGGRAYCISDDRMDAARAAINKAEGRTDDQ